MSPTWYAAAGRLERAAADLAQLLCRRCWYHRTSMEESRRADGSWVARLVVWGEGSRHADVPDEFQSYPVAYNRVSKKHPCPFGSVKP